MARTRGFPHLRRIGPLLMAGLFLVCFFLNNYYNGYQLWHSISGLVEQFAPPGTHVKTDSVTPSEPGAGGYSWTWPYLHELDGLFWTDNAVRMVSERTLRIRSTQRDNAPFGRPMHWSALPAWGLVALGAIAAPFVGWDWVEGIKIMAPWAPPILALLGFVLLAALLARFAGWAAAAVFLVATQFFPMLQDAFILGSPDHHGLQVLAFGGLVLGLLWAIWPREAQPAGSVENAGARRPIVALGLSAFCGAVGLWLGATQMAVLLALVATGLGCAILAVALGDEEDAKMPWSPVYWLFWGASGATCAMLFYLLEYAPQLAFPRLEVNHPLHAGAWLGGGIALFALHRLLLEPRKKVPSLLLLVLGLCAALCPAAVMALGRDAQFHALQDPILFRFHGLLGEFQPFIRDDTPFMRSAQMVLLALPVLISFGMLLMPERFAIQVRVLLIIMVIPAAVLLGLCFVQKRWSHDAAMASILLAVTIYSLIRRQMLNSTADRPTTAEEPQRWRRSVLFRWNPILIWLIVCAGFWGFWMNTMRVQNFQYAAASLFVGPQINMMTMARIIHDSTPEGRTPVVVHYPNTATGCGQLPFANVPVVGSQYWENLAGVRDQFTLLGHPDPAVPALIARQRGITHILTDTRSGSLDGVLEVLLGPGDPRLETLAPKTLVWRLGTPNPCPPPWLELIAEMEVPGYQFKQRLYRVNPQHLWVSPEASRTQGRQPALWPSPARKQQHPQEPDQGR